MTEALVLKEGQEELSVSDLLLPSTLPTEGIQTGQNEKLNQPKRNGFWFGVSLLFCYGVSSSLCWLLSLLPCSSRGIH